MTKIDSLTIKPLTSGFLMDVQFDGSDDPAEHAYSDLDDLINNLTLLLGPVPQIIGVDMADDGWREWDGQLKSGQEYPPGVKHDTRVQYRLRGVHQPHTPVQSSVLRWFWAGDSEYDPDSDIVAYRVVNQ